jgi:hypothetical protein
VVAEIFNTLNMGFTGALSYGGQPLVILVTMVVLFFLWRSPKP